MGGGSCPPDLLSLANHVILIVGDLQLFANFLAELPFGRHVEQTHA